MVWAVMDIGTNSGRLLIAEKEPMGELRVLERAVQIIRTGEGMNEYNKLISPEAMERTLHTLEDYARVIAGYPVKKLRLIATQAVREAANKDELVKKIKARLGWQLEIVAGETEAWLSYEGAVQGLKIEGVPLVFDIGGGSTEFMIKTAAENFQVCSLPFGALRLWENPRSDEKVQAELEQGLEDFTLPADAKLVGVGGTVTTAAAVKLALVRYAADRVQGLNLDFTEIVAIAQSLKGMKPTERLKVPGITAGREEIIIPGLQILLNIMRFFRKRELVVSDRDLLYGLIYENRT